MTTTPRPTHIRVSNWTLCGLEGTRVPAGLWSAMERGLLQFDHEDHVTCAKCAEYRDLRRSLEGARAKGVGHYALQESVESARKAGAML